MNAKLWFSLLSSGGGYSSQYQDVLDYATANSITHPEREDSILIDTLIRYFVSIGAWSLIDQIAIPGAYHNDPNFGLINLKTPGTKNLTLASGGFFNRPYGWGRFTTANRIRSNFIPSTDGVNFTQNNASILFYIPFNYTGDSSDETAGCGGAANLHGISCQVKNAGNTLTYRVNAATGITIASNTDSTGLYHLQRTGATTVKMFKNGSQFGSTSSVASTGLATQEIDIGCFNSNGSHLAPTSKYISLWIIGSGLAGLESLISTGWSSYLAGFTFDTPSVPSFPTYTSYSSDLSNYLTSAAALKSAFGASRPLVWEYVDSLSTSFQGALLGANKSCYGVPATAATGVRVTPSTNPTLFAKSTFGTLTATAQKFGSGSRIGNYIYLCPYQGKAVGKINTTNDTITYFDTTGVVATVDAGNLTGAEKWWGFEVGSDGYIYGIPYDATEVIKINPATDAITFIDTTGTVAYGGGNLSGADKWDGGTCYGDYIYGAVSSATDMLKINILLGTVSRVGSFPAGVNKWSFCQVAGNGKIYFVGYGRTDVICFDPSDNSYTTCTGEALPGSPQIAGCLMPDGNILVVPINSNVLKAFVINPDTNVVSIGATLPSDVSGFCGASLGEDGAMYAMNNTGTFICKFFYNKKAFALADNHIFSRYINRY